MTDIPKDQDGLTEEDAAKCWDEALKRALLTPSKSKKGKKMLRSGDCFLVVGGKFRIAREVASNKDGSITVDLYRNPEDYRLGVVMEHDFIFWPRYHQPRYPDYSQLIHLDLCVDAVLH